MTRRAVPTVVIVLGVVATSAYIYFQIVRGLPDSPPPPPLPTPVAGAEEGPDEPAPRPGLLPLEESDGFIRDLAVQLSEHPRFASWLVPDRLVERFVAAVANVGEGESPRP